MKAFLGEGAQRSNIRFLSFTDNLDSNPPNLQRRETKIAKKVISVLLIPLRYAVKRLSFREDKTQFVHIGQ